MRISSNGRAMVRTGHSNLDRSSEEGVLARQGGIRSEHRHGLRSDRIISRTELKSLASDLKQGLIDREEANCRFIKCVIDNSLDGKLSRADHHKIISDISSFFADDEDFLRSLESNLRKLV